jgi:hypothetical protein
MMVRVQDVSCFIAEASCCVSHMMILNCLQKCRLSVDGINDVDATELSTVKGNWGQLKAGVALDKCVSYGDVNVMC